MAFKKLKEKWEVTSNFQLVLIFVVFAITGSLSVKLGQPILDFLNLNPVQFSSLTFGKALYWFLRLLLIFPIYQVLLLVIAGLFFQFKFFWAFEKRILRRIGFKRFFPEEENKN